MAADSEYLGVIVRVGIEKDLVWGCDESCCDKLLSLYEEVVRKINFA